MAIVVAGKTGENVAMIDVGRGVPRGAPCGQLHVGFELARLLAVDAAVRSVVVAVDVSRIVGQPRESDEGALAQVAIGGAGGEVEIVYAESLQGIVSEAVGAEVVFIDIGGQGRNAVAREEPAVTGGRGLGEVGSETVGDALTQGDIVGGFELTLQAEHVLAEFQLAVFLDIVLHLGVVIVDGLPAVPTFDFIIAHGGIDGYVLRREEGETRFFQVGNGLSKSAFAKQARAHKVVVELFAGERGGFPQFLPCFAGGAVEVGVIGFERVGTEAIDGVEVGRAVDHVGIITAAAVHIDERAVIKFRTLRQEGVEGAAGFLQSGNEVLTHQTSVEVPAVATLGVSFPAT